MSERSYFPDDILAIHPHWILRKDVDKVLLYKLALDEIKYLVLPPLVGIVIPLFDGIRSLRKVAALTGILLGEDSLERLLAICCAVLSFVNRDEVKVEKISKLEHGFRQYELTRFAVNPDRFHFTRRMNMPFRALLLLSNRCQTDCRYCYAPRPKVNELSTLEWMSIFDELHALDIEVVDLSGGDPMARTDSVSLLCYLIEKDFLFLVSTKCAVDKESARKLADAGFTDSYWGLQRKFQLSLDAADSQLASFLTRTHGFLERVIQSTQNLLEAGITPHIKAVLTPYNYKQVKPLVQLFEPLGIRLFSFALYGRNCYRHDDRFFLNDKQRCLVAEACQQIEQQFPHIELTGDAIRYFTPPKSREALEKAWKARAGCSGGFTSLVIAPDGKVVLCEQVPQEKPFVVGDLRYQSVMEVWNSKELKSFLHPTKTLFAGTICETCEDFETCHYQKGWCYRDALAVYGTPYAPVPDCPRVKETHRMR